MVIKYSISPSAKTEDFVAKIYEASSPLAEIANQVIPAPHTSPVNVVFNGLDKVVHIVRLWGVTSGLLFHEYDVEPKDEVVTIFDPIRFRIGDGGTLTPVEGTDSYTNSLLIGMTTDDFTIYRNGYGFLYPGIHYGFDTVTGDVSLTFPDQFGEDEEFLIERKPKAVETTVNDSVVGKQFGGNDAIPEMFIDVVSTVNYIPAHLRHLIRLAGANANYVFPVGTSIPIGYIFRVTNFGAFVNPSDKGKVTFNNAPLLWGTTPKTEIDIQFTGTYEFEFDGINWNCTMYNALQGLPGPQILYSSSVTLLPLTGNSRDFNVTIPFTTGADYRVLFTLVTSSHDVFAAVKAGSKTPTGFVISARKISSGTKDIAIDFIIVK